MNSHKKYPVSGAPHTQHATIIDGGLIMAMHVNFYGRPVVQEARLAVTMMHEDGKKDGSVLRALLERKSGTLGFKPINGLLARWVKENGWESVSALINTHLGSFLANAPQAPKNMFIDQPAPKPAPASEVAVPASEATKPASKKVTAKKTDEKATKPASKKVTAKKTDEKATKPAPKKVTAKKAAKKETK